MTFQLKAELLTECNAKTAARLIEDPKFGAQEKHNGKRRIAVKDGQNVYCFNREGEKRELPRPLVRVLLSHPQDVFIADGELCGTVISPRYWVFDILIVGKTAYANEPYSTREKVYHLEFGNFNPMVIPVTTARTTKAKLALTQKLHDDRAEGVVYKNMTAAYHQGRSDQHFKLKFVVDCDVVVMGPSPEGHNSVEIGVFNTNGKLHRVSGMSLNGKPSVKIGDVVTVRYLYASKDFHIVQPRMIEKRTDKRPEECTISQLKQFRDYKCSSI